mgnify:CR=1 FL=1
MSETYAIELKNITKRFGKVTANDKVCLSVKKGEILSILGENGSGKTTLLKTLLGLKNPKRKWKDHSYEYDIRYLLSG